MKIRLPRPRNVSTAKQCRYMGLKVGDTIIGRETYSDSNWSEAKLTLLFAGKDEAVWTVMRRSHDKPRWRSTGKTVCYYVYTVKQTTGSGKGVSDHDNQNIYTLRHTNSNMPDLP